MRVGCCISSVDQIAVLAAAGYDFCELPAALVQPFADDAAALPALREVAAAPLPPESFYLLVPATLPLVGPHADHAELRRYLGRAFGRMRQLGGGVAVLGSGKARALPPDVPRAAAVDQLVQALRIAGEEAGRAGITLALEHLNRGETNVLNSVAECHALLQEHDLPQVELLADLYHLTLEAEPFEHVVVAGPRLAHVHVAGDERRPPGPESDQYGTFMRVLHSIGYDQRISVECRWDDFAAQSGPVLHFMRQQWRSATQQAL